MLLKPKNKMKPKKFKEATVELGKPESMTDEECGSLHIFQSPNNECISLWTAPFWQRVKFLFHGHIWLGVVSGKTQPPVWLSMVKTEFAKKKKKRSWGLVRWIFLILISSIILTITGYKEKDWQF